MATTAPPTRPAFNQGCIINSFLCKKSDNHTALLYHDSTENATATRREHRAAEIGGYWTSRLNCAILPLFVALDGSVQKAEYESHACSRHTEKIPLDRQVTE
jgi:hypothetical protein